MWIFPLCLGSFTFSGWEDELNPKPEIEPKCACYCSRNTRSYFLQSMDRGDEVCCFSYKKEFGGACENPGVIRGLSSHSRGGVKKTSVNFGLPKSTLANRYQSWGARESPEDSSEMGVLLRQAEERGWQAFIRPQPVSPLVLSKRAQCRGDAQNPWDAGFSRRLSSSPNHASLPDSPRRLSFMQPQTGGCWDVYRVIDRLPLTP